MTPSEQAQRHRQGTKSLSASGRYSWNIWNIEVTVKVKERGHHVSFPVTIRQFPKDQPSTGWRYCPLHYPKGVSDNSVQRASMLYWLC